MNCEGARHNFAAPSAAPPPRKVNEHAVKVLLSELSTARTVRQLTADRESTWLDNAMRERANRHKLETKIADLKAAIVELGGTPEEATA